MSLKYEPASEPLHIYVKAARTFGDGIGHEARERRDHVLVHFTL